MILDPQMEPQREEKPSSEKWTLAVSGYVFALALGVLTLFSGALDFGNRQMTFLTMALPMMILYDVSKVRTYIDPVLVENPFFKVKPNPQKFAFLHMNLSVGVLFGSILMVFMLVKNLDFQIFTFFSITIPILLTVILTIGFLYEFLTIQPLKHLMLGQPF